MGKEKPNAAQVDASDVHLTPADLARRLQMHVVSVNRWRTMTPQKGPAFLKIDRNNVRYTLADVEAWETRHRKKTVES